MKRAPTRKPKAAAPAAAPPQDPPGALAMRLAADIQALARAGGTYRVAYDRLTGAIDQLKAREPYLALEQDLVAILQPPPAAP